jgi:hypothetical protein
VAGEAFAAFVWSLSIGIIVGASFAWQGWNPYFGGLLAGLATFVGLAVLSSLPTGGGGGESDVPTEGSDDC